MTSDTTASPPNRSPSATDAALTAVGPADALETALDAAAALVDECVVRVDTDGLAIDAMDPATVAMVSLSVSADAFDTYDATETRIGVNLDRLRNVLGMADADQPVRLALDAETRTLHVRVGELSYTLALVDPDAIRSPPDHADFADQFTADVTVTGREYSRAVDAADMVSDHLALGVEDDHLYARADGDTDTVSLELPADDCEAFDPGPAHSLFSLQYLSAVEGSVPDDRPVRLRLGEEAPLGVSFDLPDGAGSVEYVVSPRLTKA